ncbi:hypothetical protein [Streptomyces sp. C10-9-1]|uniref:hypothetical protein n=1 Tax=Streptomyces sp. C10-9-1 TaxID=1859285 RepID=UPI003D74BD14
MDEPISLEAPCNCGALGDHERSTACNHSSIVQIGVTGDRSGCLQAIGVLRTSYYVYVEHEWQNPESGFLGAPARRCPKPVEIPAVPGLTPHRTTPPRGRARHHGPALSHVVQGRIPATVSSRTPPYGQPRRDLE